MHQCDHQNNQSYPLFMIYILSTKQNKRILLILQVLLWTLFIEYPKLLLLKKNICINYDLLLQQNFYSHPLLFVLSTIIYRERIRLWLQR